jgi:hypothetical protein
MFFERTEQTKHDRILEEDGDSLPISFVDWSIEFNSS